MIKRTVIVGLASLLISPVWGKKFTSQFCEFELPPGWSCALEGTEWVCQSSNKDRKKEAIIILAAKIRGKADDLAQYQSYLKNQKTFTLPGGRTQISEPKYTKINEINAHKWVDALHLASEVPGFYTRYLATVKGDLGVAVTFSVGKDHYEYYQSLFEKIVATLKVFRQVRGKVGDFARVAGKEKDILDQNVVIPHDDPLYGLGQGQRRKRKGGTSATQSMLYILLAAGAGLALTKLRKKKPKKKKKKKPADD